MRNGTSAPAEQLGRAELVPPFAGCCGRDLHVVRLGDRDRQEDDAGRGTLNRVWIQSSSDGCCDKDRRDAAWRSKCSSTPNASLSASEGGGSAAAINGDAGMLQPGKPLAYASDSMVMMYA